MSSAESAAAGPGGPAPDRSSLTAIFRAAAGGGGGGRDALLQHAVQGGLQVAPGMFGCSITQLDGARFGTIASSDDLAFGLDERQYAAGVGPCVSAARDRQMQVETAPDHWSESNPAFQTEAARLGVTGIASVPLLGGDRPAGMNFYSSVAGALASERAVATMGLLARAVARSLGGGLVLEPSAGDEFGLAAARRRRELIRHACAALVERLGLDERAAFDRLVRDSRARHRSIFDSARDVLEEDS